MVQRFFGEEITDHLKNKLQTALVPDDITNGGLGLKFVQRGGLEYFPTAALGSLLPAIFLKLVRIDNSLGPPFGKMSQVYRYRLVYCRQYSDSEFAVNLKYVHARHISEVIYDNFQLLGIVLPGGVTIEFVTVDGIDLEPLEDDLAFASGDQISALAIDISAHIRVTR